MLAIKLKRIGKKHQPSYRIVVAEKRSKMLAPPVEDLGAYNPRTKKTAMDKTRASYWLGVGAQPTVSIHNLLVKEGVINAPKMKIKVRAKQQEEAAAPSATVAAEAKPVEKTAPEAAPEVAPEAT